MSEYHRQTGLLTRRAALGLLGTGAVLAACSPSAGPVAGPTPGLLPPPTTPAATGDVIGSGSVRVGLLLPRSAQGNAASLATSMRNAAQMAMADFTGPDITVLVKDSLGTPEGAAAAAQAAIAEGAELILGPIFAAEARGVAPVTLAANVPVISFSSDPTAASAGIYVMGFMVDDQVRQLMAQAAASGRRSVAAVVSDGPYGVLAEAALRESTTRSGMRLVQIERFTAGNAAAAAQAVAANASQIDCIFVPDGPGVAPTVASALQTAGIDLARVKLLGSGQWNDPSVYTSAALTGGWFPAPDISGFQGFAGRYRGMFGADPQLVATLAYDAVVLAAGLVKQAGLQRFQRSVLTNPEGFLSSVNGLFRFNADGTNDRGLAIYEVTGAAPRLVQPAPRAFTGF
jgi:ABC-type branched-subunit amino acid transport system substrate-binding protein